MIVVAENHIKLHRKGRRESGSIQIPSRYKPTLEKIGIEKVEAAILPHHEVHGVVRPLRVRDNEWETLFEFVEKLGEKEIAVAAAVTCAFDYWFVEKDTGDRDFRFADWKTCVEFFSEYPELQPHIWSVMTFLNPDNKTIDELGAIARIARIGRNIPDFLKHFMSLDQTLDTFCLYLNNKRFKDIETHALYPFMYGEITTKTQKLENSLGRNVPQLKFYMSIPIYWAGTNRFGLSIYHEDERIAVAGISNLPERLHIEEMDGNPKVGNGWIPLALLYIAYIAKKIGKSYISIPTEEEIRYIYIGLKLPSEVEQIYRTYPNAFKMKRKRVKHHKKDEQIDASVADIEILSRDPRFVNFSKVIRTFGDIANS